MSEREMGTKLIFGTVQETPQDTARRILFGTDGLRTGWSVLLFGVLVFSFGTLADFITRRFGHLPPLTTRSGEMESGGLAVSEGLNFVLLALAGAALSLVERQPFGRFGLALRRALPDFTIGLGWGLTMLSLLVGALLWTHGLAFDGQALAGAAAVRSGAAWALAFLFLGVFEEFLFRGYLQYTVARGVARLAEALSPGNRHAHAIGFWVTALVFSVGLFMAGHLGNRGETAAGVLAVGAAGAVFAFSLWRTGTLWWAIGFHTAWDWAQSFLYGVPDSGNLAHGHWLASHPRGPALLSGGPDGPEGSLLALPVLGLVALVIHWTLPRRAYPRTAAEGTAAAGAAAQLD